MVKKSGFSELAIRGRCARRLAILLIAAGSILFPRELQTQERTPAQLARYHLIQVVGLDTFFDKINETSRQGYRVVAVSHAAGQSLAAIMERVESPSESYNYLSIQVLSSKTKHATPGKVKAEVAEQLNTAGAKGYRLRMTLSSSGEGMPDVALMESASGQQQHYRYALIAPGGLLGDYSKDELSRLTTAGYRWTATATRSYGGALLIFEKETDPGGSQVEPDGQPVGGPLKRFKFPENDFIRFNLPEKQLRKLAAEGARVIDFFPESPIQMVLAMVDTIPPSAPYEYVILKDKNLASPLALHANLSKVEAGDLTRAGQQGFRLMRLSAAAPPFLMEKAPGSVWHYEYEFVSSTRLPELAEQLNNPTLAGFHVVKMESLEDRLLVIMEKTDAAQP